MMTSVAFSPAPVARSAVRPARCARMACHAVLPQRPVDMQPLKAGAAGLAAALLLAMPAAAGPLDKLLPDSAPMTENNYKLFERDLGEGRRLVPERDQVKDSAPGRLPAPLPFRNAERATPNMKFEGGEKPLPGIAKSNAKDSVSAPLTESKESGRID